MSKQSDALKAAEAALKAAEAELAAAEHAPVPNELEAVSSGSVYLGHVGEPAVKGKDF